jgi:putative hydrolase of the HAD superfamily
VSSQSGAFPFADPPHSGPAPAESAESADDALLDTLDDVEAVLLDLGGVFYLPEHAPMRRALAPFEIEMSPTDLDRAHYAGIAALTGHDAVGHHGDGLSIWHSYNRAYASACGIDTTDLDDAVTALLAEFEQGDVWTRPIPGAREALDRLAARGFALAVVSNADGTVEQQLIADALCQVGPGTGVEVGAVLDSTAVGVSKPDPAIFEMALDALGVTAERTIHVGDTPAADVAGALAAGIRPVLVDPYDLHPGAEWLRVRSLADVVDLLPARRSL